VPGNLSKIQKLAFGFSALFLFVYLLDYVPGIMAENGKMFGLFSMTPIVDFGHLALGTLAAISAWHSAKASRIYFYVLGVWYGIDVILFFVSHFNTMSLLVNAAVNMPHLLTSIAAFWIAIRVECSHATPIGP
jgi:Domain of unknown function (DUF4383)